MNQTILPVIKIRCGFCDGSGKDPFHVLSDLSTCQVCGGTGQVYIEGPAIPCAFCRGTGAYHTARITCTVCGGKGMVTALEGPTTQCPECQGTGTATGSGLPCLTCHGKGVISKKKTT